MLGTIRINANDLKPYRLTSAGYRKVNIALPGALAVVDLFKAHGNIKYLISKDPQFLKGALSPDGRCLGARIDILPDGQKLDKAFSLFAKHLTINDESSDDHWDVLYQNPGGTYAYIYTIDKKDAHRKKKYHAVQLFEKYYPRLKRRVSLALKDDEDLLALPMYTLLKTYMRVGNEIYYKAHGHKGLSTLKKSDIELDNDKVRFSYISKGGVPRTILERFPATYVERLKSTINALAKDSFVFTAANGRPLKDVHFKEAFKKYCGKEFYPHIVRSYFATKTAKEFLKNHRKSNKAEVHALFSGIAEKLGHRKFDKKSHEWKESYNITINYYIKPDVLNKIKALV